MAHLISCCVDKKELKKEGMSYLKGNKLLAMDVLALMDHIKILLEYQLGVNLESLDQTVSLRPSEFEFEEQYDTMAKTLMNTLTDQDYTKVTAKLNKQLDVMSPPASTKSKRKLKSKYLLKQKDGYDYGKMIEKINVIESDESIQPKNKEEKLAAMNTSIEYLKDEDDKRGIDFSLSQVPMAKIKDIMNNKAGEAVSGAKRKGNFSDHLETIVKKHKQHDLYIPTTYFLSVPLTER